MTPCLYLLTGISFAGKSVLARRLADHFSALRVDPDDISHRLGLGLAGEFLSDAQWAQIHALAEQEACRCLRVGVSVVNDTTAFTRQQRDAVRALAARCGATAPVVFVDTPREVAHQRWRANELAPHRARVHPDDFAMVAEQFEPPDSPEGTLHFAPDVEVGNWITTHFGKKNA